MDVQKRGRAGLEEGGAEHPHETCAEHEVWGGGANAVRQGLVEGRPSGEVAIGQALGGQLPARREGLCTAGGAVRDEGLQGKEGLGPGAGFKKGLKVTAPARGQDKTA